MRRNAFLALMTGLVAMAGQAAFAQPAYKAQDIIEHFAPANLGPTRGLCLGTEEECNNAAAKTKPARPLEAFDLVVTFDYNSDVLTNEARQNLDEFSKALKDPKLAGSSFVVEGHTDARGSEDYNLGLSERRAKAVVTYLSEKGVDRAKLEAQGFGKAKPRTSDPFDAANRRVETRLRTE
jgi:outer membrane protein OmpA-like peptidoglycan-associated protein